MKKRAEEMKERAGAQAVMTVFFALLAALFLGFSFLLIESVRYQGLRAHMQQTTDMGHYSLFGEFEKKLLEDFELFAVDGAYGTGDFSIERVADRLGYYIRLNTEPGDGIMSLFCFDPWKSTLVDTTVTAYTLLSDGGGEALYQEAVTYMRKTAVMNVTGRLMSWYKDAQKAQENQKIYEKERLSADQEMEELQRQEAQKREEMRAEEAAGGEADGNDGETNAPENPLPAIRRLLRRDILSVVCAGLDISGAAVQRGELASKRGVRKGNLPVKRKYAGLQNDLIFREYLLDRFACCLDPDSRARGELKYELEYILGGKLSDRKNLKAVMNRLLLLREGCNYLYGCSDEGMNAGTTAVAAALIGWTGIPALTAVMKHALLLGWAYAESLMDVRGLMEGGKVPLMKTEGDWKVTLDKLAQINELLDGGGNKGESGISYRGYLRLLLNLQGISDQKKRTVDLVELRIRAGSGLSGFKADHCVVAVKDETLYRADALFSKVTGALMKLGARGFREKVSGGFSCLEIL